MSNKLTKPLNKTIWMALSLILICQVTMAGKAPTQHAIASAHPLATKAGIQILQNGGNAFDAAIAVTASLAVVEPYSSGIGGGGFYLLHQAKDKKEVMIDAREVAPLKAHRDMYLDAKGDIIPRASLDGPLSAGIPGIPAGLVHLAKNYGQLPLSKSLAPAINYADNGFKADRIFVERTSLRLDALQASPAAAKVFLKNNRPPREGDLIVQKDLAKTLQMIADKGFDGFYKGELAIKLVNGTNRAGGIWQLKDLAEYKVKERQPVKATVYGTTITTAPPPSSGGIVLLEILNILNQDKLFSLDEVSQTHLLVEAMRYAYRDRAEYLGDPDFVTIPSDKLLSLDYANDIRSHIKDTATKSSDLKAFDDGTGGFHTTHFSVLDKKGNRVAATLSINYSFGSGFVVPGTGVLLNNEMDDFSSKPGEPNVYGLVGAEANAIAPKKRPLSSMTPTFVEDENRIGILGTPGGSRIITMVLLGVLEFMQDKAPIDWVSKPRFHHQFLPDIIQYEPNALEDDLVHKLKNKGHHFIELPASYGNMHAIVMDKTNGEVEAASDPRGIGEAITAN